MLSHNIQVSEINLGCVFQGVMGLETAIACVGMISALSALVEVEFPV
jgi:hypothetical protein